MRGLGQCRGSSTCNRLCLGWWTQTSLHHSSQNHCASGVLLVGQVPRVLLLMLEWLQSPFSPGAGQSQQAAGWGLHGADVGKEPGVVAALQLL